MLSPPEGLYNISVSISFPGLTRMGSMLLLPVLLATSFWSCKPFFLSPLFPVCGQHSPGSKLQCFLPLTQFLRFPFQVEMDRQCQCKPRSCGGRWSAALRAWSAQWAPMPSCTGTSIFPESHQKGYCTCQDSHLFLMTVAIEEDFKLGNMLMSPVMSSR